MSLESSFAVSEVSIRNFLPGTAKCCTSSPPSNDCWLCKQVNQCNAVLAFLCLELTEEEPGKLCLRTRRNFNYDVDTTFHADGVEYGPLFALACLSRQHKCIKRLSVCHDAFRYGAIPDARQLGPSSAVECIEISGRAAPYWYSLLYAVGDVFTLRSLRVEGVVVDSAFASKLKELLESNMGCLRELSIAASDGAPAISKELISAFYQCEGLTEVSLYGRPTLEATAALERLLQSNERIQKLSLRENAHSQAFLGVLCNSLRVNLSPTVLHYECTDLDFGLLLKVLEYNSGLKHLVLSGDAYRQKLLEKHHGVSLNALLAHSASLRRFEIRHCICTSVVAEEIAAGLACNGSLEHFDLSWCRLSCDAALALCTALDANNTLKLLVFRSYSRFQQEHVGLSGRLVAAKCFARVVIIWPQVYMQTLTEALKVPALCPEELHFAASGTCNISFERLCKAIGNSTVKHLYVKFSNCYGNQADLLCEALIASSSVRKLALWEDSMSVGCCFTVAKALEQNRTVTEISLEVNKVHDVNIQHLSSLALASDALQKLSLNCIDLTPSCVQSLNSLCPLLMMNGTLTSFSIFNERHCIECLHDEIRDCVDKNRRKWNCALQFVLSPCVNKRWALAFESLQKTPHFLHRIATASGKSLEDVSRLVRSAKYFIVRNYLIITGVVSQGVTCHPYLGTQVDSLNSDCWLAIGEYLTVSDVVDDSCNF